MVLTLIDPTQISKAWLYRRPVLQYGSATVINLETGILGTSGQATILFPDGLMISDSTAGHINCNLAQVASTGGSPQSGLRTGTVVNNTWYSIYAVKANSSTAFVTIADTVIPIQANFATLNANFGTNAWIYLGVLPFGDNSTLPSAIPLFFQSGNTTSLYNKCQGLVENTRGVRLAANATATSVTWTYASGTLLSSGQIPAQLNTGSVQTTFGNNTSNSILISDALVNWYYIRFVSGTIASNVIFVPDFALTTGIKVNTGAAIGADIVLYHWIDSVLGVGTNPFL